MQVKSTGEILDLYHDRLAYLDYPEGTPQNQIKEYRHTATGRKWTRDEVTIPPPEFYDKTCDVFREEFEKEQILKEKKQNNIKRLNVAKHVIQGLIEKNNIITNKQELIDLAVEITDKLIMKIEG